MVFFGWTAGTPAASEPYTPIPVTRPLEDKTGSPWIGTASSGLKRLREVLFVEDEQESLIPEHFIT